MHWMRITVGDQERILITRSGSFAAILSPGDYRLRTPEQIEIERHQLRDLIFRSFWSAFLVQQRPELVQRHFVKVETSETQVGLVYVNGGLYRVLTPAKRLLFWRDAAAVSAEVVDIIPAQV